MKAYFAYPKEAHCQEEQKALCPPGNTWLLADQHLLHDDPGNGTVSFTVGVVGQGPFLGSLEAGAVGNRWP